MFTNKHVVVALLVAPVLSILAWFAVGNLIGEKAAPAQPGEAYPLVEKSNCRYSSGLCELENQDVKLTLKLDETVGVAIELTASHPLEAALMSVSHPDRDPGPRAMQAGDATGLRWRLPLSDVPSVDERIRVVISVADSAYFADASTRFLQAEE
ncbi:hypothetical protein R0135_01435 [Congregibacter variabilis]|uniref:Uncharacterized protein n=1 Tax=Congregibacter variabilis TaxID=3081200 RepID=A0ABZ0I3V5_9GAMM|nr:hypothetical protein R0135_01435 [Congregibacter sp. IMCC43200]